MATQSYHNCPICKEDIMPGETRRIIGHDMTRWPDVPPVSIYAHRACAQAVGFEGAVVLTSVTDPGRIVDLPTDGQLTLSLA